MTFFYLFSFQDFRLFRNRGDFFLNYSVLWFIILYTKLKYINTFRGADRRGTPLINQHIKSQKEPLK